MNRRGFEFSFAWMFAVIVGAVIIFLAIYASIKFIKTEGEISETEIGKEIGILLTPVETSGETGRASTISLLEKAVINNECSNRGNFGSQKISVGDGVPSTFYNKYIFSSDEIKGKNLYVFSKSFNFPYKVADVMFIWSDEGSYCFINPPDEIEEEITDLDLKNVEVVSSKEECVNDKIVCFSSLGCDVDVFLGERSVSKDGKKVYYSDEFDASLIYGSIFADPEIYECQVERLMKRASELALLYRDKIKLIEKAGCSSVLEEDLTALSQIQVSSSAELSSLEILAKEIRRKDGQSLCEIF